MQEKAIQLSHDPYFSGRILYLVGGFMNATLLYERLEMELTPYGIIVEQPVSIEINIDFSTN